MWPNNDNTESDVAAGAGPDARSDGSLDTVFDVLSDRERRYALYYLYSTNGEVASFAEVADYVVARDADSVEDLEDDDVLERLHHVHLPKLEATGVVEYDPRSGDVRYRGHPLVERGLALALRLEND